MNEKLRKIVNHYGIKSQLKYFQSEVFELNEAILDKENASAVARAIEDFRNTLLLLLGNSSKDSKKEHIKEEIADVMVMLKQFQLYYDISTDEIKEMMKFKTDRQIKRIEVEKNEKVQQQLASKENAG